MLRRLREIARGGYVLVSGGQPSPAAKARVRSALQRIVLGIAIDKLGWILGGSNQPLVTTIMQTLADAGVSVQEATLWHCFKEAEDHHLKKSRKAKSDLASAKSD